MGALLSLPFKLLNLLLPFTRSGTPLSQDLLHTAVLCGTLYFAPQIAEWYKGQPEQPGEEVRQEEEEEEEEAPLEDRLILQHDGIAPVGRPPPAPTPPPHVEEEHAPELQNLPQQAHHNLPNEPAAQGPIHPRPTPQNRTIGTKKAKSLARRDQQRAYNEWLRSEADRRKAEEEEGRSERDALLAAEKARRTGIEAEIREREKGEREARKMEERREAEEEGARRERVVGSVKKGMERKGVVDLVDEAVKEGKDVLWVERLIRASGLVQQLQKDGGHVLVTGQSWLVKIDEEIMQRVYAEAERFGEGNGGKVGFEEFGHILEKAVLARATA
jgi:hypothetical protein